MVVVFYDSNYYKDKKESQKKEKEALKPEKIDDALKDNLKPDKNEDTLKGNLKPEKIDDTLKDKEIMKNNKEEKKELDVNEEKKKDFVKDVEKIKDVEKVKRKDIDNETPLIENVAPKKEREGLKRTASAPPKVTEVNALCTCCCVHAVLYVHAIMLTSFLLQYGCGKLIEIIASCRFVFPS